MLVISDTTPIHYLILIGEIELLRQLYGKITIPIGVIAELSVLETPATVRSWVSDPPAWVDVVSPSIGQPLPFPKLGRGEREGIALAMAVSGTILLTDDSGARTAAESYGIRVVPTIRLLSTAQELGLVDLRDALDRLRATNFRVAQSVIDRIFKELADSAGK